MAGSSLRIRNVLSRPSQTPKDVNLHLFAPFLLESIFIFTIPNGPVPVSKDPKTKPSASTPTS